MLSSFDKDSESESGLPLLLHTATKPNCAQLIVVFGRTMFLTLLGVVQTLLGYGERADGGGEDVEGGQAGQGGEEEDCVGEEEVEAFLSAAKPEHQITTALFVGDSHMKTLIPGHLEEGLGCKVTHGILPASSYTSGGGHPGRSYNSSKNWINAKFRLGSQELRVPALLREGVFQFLIISLCCNDVTNIRGLAQEIQLLLADTSARNTLEVAEKAITEFEELQVIFILDSPPRIDSKHLQELSEYRSKCLTKRLATSNLQNRIKFCPLDELNIKNEKQAEVLFGSSDGIHMQGRAAPMLYTSAVVGAITTANNEV